MLLTILQLTGQPLTTKSHPGQNISSVEKACIKLLYTISHWILIFTEWYSEWFLGDSVTTEAQKSEVTCPRPHSWSETKLDLIQSHPELVLTLLAKEERRQFALLTTFCDNLTSHKKIHKEVSKFRASLGNNQLESVASLCPCGSTHWGHFSFSHPSWLNPCQL